MVTAERSTSTRRWSGAIIGFLSVVLLVAAWHLWVHAQGVNRILMPTPLDVFEEFRANTEMYMDALGSTMRTGLAGLLLGTVFGSALAIFSWLSTLLNGMVSVSALIVRSVPIIIVVPVLTRVLGFGSGTTIVIVTLISFFPALILVSTGLRELPPSAVDLASVLGANRRRRLLRLALPAAVPKLAGSVRMSAGNAVLAAMVTEFLTGAPGLGLIFLLARSDLSSERAWAASIVGAVAAVVLFSVASWLEGRAEERMR